MSIKNNKKRLKAICFKSFCLPRQLPTFPGRHQPSIISSAVLNFRVRYGYGCVHCDIATELLNTISVFSTFSMLS